MVQSRHMKLRPILQIVAIAICFFRISAAESGNADYEIQQAVTMLKNGNYARAAFLYREALRKLKEEAGPDRRLITVLSNLGVAEFHLGKLADSEAHYLRSLEEMKRHPAVEAIERPAVLNNLASLYSKAGRYMDSLALYEQAVKMRERNPDANLGLSLNNVAVLYQKLGRFDDAERSARRAVSLLEKGHGSGNKWLAESLLTLGSICIRQGKLSEAEQRLRGSLEIRESLSGTEHPSIGPVLCALADVRSAQDRFAEMEPLLERAIAIYKAAGLENTPETAVAYNNLAQALKLSGRYREADARFRKAIEIWEKTLGPRHPDLALGLVNLADLYRAEGKLAGSAKLLERAVAILDTADARKRLAAVYLSQGRKTEAARIQRSAYSKSVVQTVTEPRP